MNEQVVLASASPRRKALLEQAGISFIVDTASVPEDSDEKNPGKLVMELAQRKAKAVLSRHPDKWVIGADTVVFYDGEILGKPQDENEAYDMLSMLCGRRHEVITGVCMLKGTGNGSSAPIKKLFTEKTSVYMYDMPSDILKWYVSTKEPLDKAGAYGIQGKGAVLVERIEGDYNNVVGLPLAKVFAVLEKLL